jgi:hypothetical protein
MSAGPIRDTWQDRDLPLLEAIAIAEEEEGAREPLHSFDSRLSDATGLDDGDVQLGLRALYEDEYITGNPQRLSSRIFDLVRIRLLGKGRRTVGQWPPEDQYDAFVRVLQQQIAEAPTEAERSRLEKLREVATGVGRDVLTSVLSAWARQAGGL